MKKFFLTILIVLGFGSCAKDVSWSANEKLGSIYGVVTVKETAEPMRATGVELYYGSLLLLKTVTYDDGHYEFENLSAGEYELKVVASGYKDVTYSVIVEAGRTARADMQLQRINTYMTVSTLAATEVNGDKATLNGKYTYQNYAPSVVGFVYSTSPTPNNGGTTITSSLTKSFSNVISNLKKGKYYFQAYAKNNVGIEYGEVLSFEISGQPSVTTLDATNIAETTATLNGRIDYEGDPAYTERGFVYSSSFPNPTIDDPATATTKVVVSGTSKEFSVNIAGLTKNSTYYVRAYVVNGAGVFYGNVEEFSNSDYIILQSDGIMVHKYDVSSGTTWSSANDLCKISKVGDYSDWRLPTIGECHAIYDNKAKLNISDEYYYWSSDVHTFWIAYDTYTNHYYYDFWKGSSASSDSTSSDKASRRARCVRTLK